MAQPERDTDDSIMITDDLSQNTAVPTMMIESATRQDVRANQNTTTLQPESATKHDDLDKTASL